MTVCRRKTVSSKEWQEQFMHGIEPAEFLRSEGALTAEQWKRFRDWRPQRKGGHSSESADVSFDAIRVKKSRLAKTAKTIAGLHGDRARFITITCKQNITDKKDFLYLVENFRKKLQASGYAIKYSGMIERQERGAWHLHALAYRFGGVERWSGVKDWDFGAMNRIAVKMGLNIDGRKLGKAKRTSKKISSYMSKLNAVVVAAYAAKKQTGEDYCYTLTSKGCDLPRRKYIYDVRKAFEFIHGVGFEKKEFKGFCHYLTEDERFSRELYFDSG